MADVQITARALAGLLGDWRGEEAAYRALSDRIRLLILDGRIPTDTRLPAERELAAGLQLSRTTVAAAYRQLRERDFLRSVRGSGSIARLPGVRPGTTALDSGASLDFSRAALPAISQVAAAAVTAAEQLPRYLTGYDYDTLGLPELRDGIAARYTAAGLTTSAEQIMITLGAQNAIGLVARSRIVRGDRALIEMPSYPHAYDALRTTGARLVPITVTAEQATGGWDVAMVEQAIERASPALAYLMPDFHNPTGASMPAPVRARVCRAAARQGTVIVVDETTADLDIDRRTDFMPFAAYDEDDATIVTIGSAGKTVWGGLRLGWVRADASTIGKLVAGRASYDLGTPVLEQLMLLELLPHMSEIIQTRRSQLRTTRDRLEALLGTHFPDWTVPHICGGLAIWAGLGAPLSSQLALAARSQGLIIAAGPRFGIDGAFERFLRVPITYGLDETERAVAALHRAWQAILRTPMPVTADLSTVI